MLTHFEFGPKKNITQEKQVYGTRYRRMIFYLFPGFFHFTAPVNIIQNDYTVMVSFHGKLVEITRGRLVPVIAVDICKVKTRKCLKQYGQRRIKTGSCSFDVLQTKCCEIF